MNARTDPSSLAEDVARLRVPPHSEEAEQSVLGALLLDTAAWDRVGDILTEADFYTHGHRLIFSAIGALAKACKPGDVVTVFERLERTATSTEFGGLPYLNALAQSVPGTSNIRRYAEIVRERSILRRVIYVGDDMATAAFNPQGRTVAEILDAAASAIGKLERTGQRAAPKAIGDLLLGALDRYQARANGDQIPGIQTGMRQLDAYLAPGLKPGKVYGIAARPSVGKSSLARSIAIRASSAGHRVLVLSQEMPQDEQTDCVIAELGRINSERLQTGKFDHEDWTRMTEAVEIARDLPLLFDEQGSLTLGDIRSKARAVKGLQVLVVDYLQLCASTLKGSTTNDQIAELSKGIKALALEMGIPVLLLSQLNRDVEKRADKEPTMADFRDSGAIEQDLDVALMLWTVDETNPDSRIVGCKVAKNRGGRKGSFAMRFDCPVYGWHDCEFPPKTMRKGGGL
jgi:replicative DNA helicase